MPIAISPKGLRISIDRGGTFTDCICKVPAGDDVVVKILSVDPNNYHDAPTEAIRQVLQKYRGREIPRGSLLDLEDVEWIRMGTTVATNALLERQGERTALLITQGFKDLLCIGNQSRPFMFDLSIKRPEPLYDTVCEVPERVVLARCTDSNLRNLDMKYPKGLHTEVGVSGEELQIIQPLDINSTRKSLTQLYQDGVRSVAICLMHSYIYPKHELQIRDLAKAIGFEHISLSSEVSQRAKIVPRGNSAVVDAYLTPTIERYLNKFSANFPDIEKSNMKLEFMQSDGGLVPSKKLSGLRSILSGPAGGVVGYAQTCFDSQNPVPVIGFDMGGTSTDVSRFSGSLQHLFETNTAGVNIQSPQLDINTIAAGGGSILSWRDGLMSVGPESASSHPGPACYRKGGPLTLTDANLALGRLIPERFPAVFGPEENEMLDYDIVISKFAILTEIINRETNRSLLWSEVAEGFIKVANAAMCEPIRSLTEARGHNPSLHNLSCFGGAGGQHACSIAEMLGIKRVLIHKYSSLLSAYGIGLADVVHEAQKPSAKIYDDAILPEIQSNLDDIEQEACQQLLNDGFLGMIYCSRFLNMRYDGSDTAMMVSADVGVDSLRTFIDCHHKEFGFTPTNRKVIVDDIRVRATGRGNTDTEISPFEELEALKEDVTLPKPELIRPVYFSQSGWLSTPVYSLNSLLVGTKVIGPALIIDNTQTILVNPGSMAKRLTNMLVLEIETAAKESVSATVIDPIQLSVFRHRFMGIAEQMGRMLQKVSVSANIKERLDFSCAIFTPEGNLVANAPHVPAMIGSMAFAVKSQIDRWDGKLQDGDVLLSNSPECGGTHLPDLTIITPVFDESGKDIIFWAASRGHHADVGGILPGSMPPTSRELWEEGAIFTSFLLVRNGKFAEAEFTRLMVEEPAKYPGSSGTRCLQDNITDLKAQVAANNCGIRLIRQLIEEYTMDIVQVYMNAIQDSAELAIRNLFKRLSSSRNTSSLEATDFMDDGTAICLKIKIDSTKGSAVFDFTGTGPEVYGNWNAPIAICNSAVLYSLRCLVNSDIPLNNGCMKPVQIIIPPASLLNPTLEAAVCAGNVLTSQRLVDVIFKAFEACAASQGCMNNFTFGINGEGGFGYYETIAGGSGAGPTWAGTGGVHTNMTNTRITDPETLERRYPVILRQFSLREGSGGAGKYPGGDGIIRDVEFRVPMSASILSERRSFQPYGMNGGENGERGQNLWVKRGGRRIINLGGKNSVRVEAGDRMVIRTPGGGGYGFEREGKMSLPLPFKSSTETLSFTPVANGSIEMSKSLAEQV
ncbi:MAG: hypothetical protein M1834_005339 [Cirrosporium novae-zelandiae]|nr:MAG: hypothetical protein M1834_005339 [Cirrosporium novae-zelandiae]